MSSSCRHGHLKTFVTHLRFSRLMNQKSFQSTTSFDTDLAFGVCFGLRKRATVSSDDRKSFFATIQCTSFHSFSPCDVHSSFRSYSGPRSSSCWLGPSEWIINDMVCYWWFSYDLGFLVFGNGIGKVRKKRKNKS